MKQGATLNQLLLLFILSPLSLFAQTAKDNSGAVRHEFLLTDFKTESGKVLPQAHTVYGTYGH